MVLHPKVFVKDGRDRPLRVAVVDFTNLAPRSDEAGRVITNAIVTYMLSTGAFDVVEPGVVDQAMKEQRIIPPPSGMDAKSCAQLRRGPERGCHSYRYGRGIWRGQDRQ